MRQFIRFSTVFITLCVMGSSLAAADAESGEEIAKKCAVCHGKQGVAKDPEVPNLAGQSAFYIEKSLKDFQSGAREDRRMTLMVKPLTEQDIKDLAAWYASFEVTVTPAAE